MKRSKKSDNVGLRVLAFVLALLLWFYLFISGPGKLTLGGVGS